MTNMAFEVSRYLTAQGVDTVQEFLDALLDPLGRRALARRLLALEAGQLGDHAYCRDGVWELRVHAGPGYRVYFARNAKHRILLLTAGTKRTQERDIRRAVTHWQQFRGRR